MNYCRNKNSKKKDNGAKLKELKHQKCALLRRISRRKSAKIEINKANKTYLSQKMFNKILTDMQKDYFLHTPQDDHSLTRSPVRITSEKHIRTLKDLKIIYNPPPGA